MQPRRLLTALAIGIPTLALLAPIAQAATKTSSTTSADAAGTTTASRLGCDSLPYTTTFAAFGDTNLYTLAPNGSFEGGLGGWTVSKGVTLVADAGLTGGALANTTALELAPGASATSPAMCANGTTPKFRFMNRSMTSGDKAYTVAVSYTDPLGGRIRKSALGSTSKNWNPSARFQVDTDRILVDASGWGTVQITITAPKDGAIRIDDLYMDPRMR